MSDHNLPDIASLWDYGEPALTEQRFRELLPEASQVQAYRLELLTQLARTLSLQRRFDEAHAVLDEVDADLTPEMNRPRIRSWLERGRTLNSAGDPARARPFFESAETLAIDCGEDSLAVDAVHMQAIVAPPEETLDLNLRALALAGQSADPQARRWQGSLLNNIGWTYHAQGDFESALHYLTLARDFRAEQGAERELLIARWCVARVRRDLGQVTQALAEQELLLAEYDALGKPDGYVHEEMAECLWLLDDVDAARPHFAQAYELLAQDAWLAANEPDRLKRLQALATS